MLTTGTRVAGFYCGNHAFAGPIAERRHLTVPTDGAVEYMIDLEAPIEVYGEVRSRLCLVAKHDGSPSSYTKFSDRIYAA